MLRMTRLGGLVALAAVLAAGCQDSPPPAADKGGKGKAVGITVDVVTMPGLEQAIRENAGKPVLVDFWATWCQPCRESFPHFVHLSKDFGPQGLACISVSLDDPETIDRVKAFLTQQDATFTNLLLQTLDEAGAKVMRDRFRFPNAIPHTVLFDKGGNRIWDSATSRGGDELLEKLIRQELTK